MAFPALKRWAKVVRPSGPSCWHEAGLSPPAKDSRDPCATSAIKKSFLQIPCTISPMRRLGLIVGGVLFLCFTAPAFPEPVSQLHPTNYVNDFAHVLSPQTEDALNDVCRQVEEKAHAQIAVATVNSTDGKDVFDYSVELYQAWGVGSKSTNRGVLILYAIQDRKYYTTVGYGLEPILPDGKVGGFGRDAVPLLKQGNYNGAIKLVTLRVANVIAQDAGIQLTGAQQAPPERTTAPGISAGTIVWIVIIAIVVLATPLRKVLFWWLLFSGGPRWGGGGGWGGGGFGGGGGGFGGFGGGSTGGGGAGGSW